VIDLDDVCRTVSLVLGRRGAKPDDRLMQDLGAESLELLSILVTVEEKYGVKVDESAMAAVCTVRDLYDVVLTSPHEPTTAADPRRPA